MKTDKVSENIQRLMEKMERVSENQAVFSTQLEKVVEQLDDSIQSQGQIGSQINAIGTDVATMKQENISWRAELNSWRQDINNWRNSLPDMYVPRREHDARGHEARIVALEEFRFSISKQSSDLENKMHNEISSVVKEVLQAELRTNDKISVVQLEEKNQKLSLLQWIASNWVSLLMWVTSLAFAIISLLHSLR